MRGGIDNGLLKTTPLQRSIFIGSLAPVTEDKPMATYKMSQGDLYSLLSLGWQHYTDNQAALGKYKKSKYTPTLGAESHGAGGRGGEAEKPAGTGCHAGNDPQ